MSAISMARRVDGSDSAPCSRAQEILSQGARQLLNIGRVELAEELALRALAENEDCADCQSVMASVLDHKGDWRASLMHLRRAYALAPQAPQMRLNLAMALLRRGDIGEGLPFYEARIEKPTWDGFATRDSRIAAHARLLRPGDPVEGKRIVVLAEQGMGDCIMFARLIPVLAERGARIALACNPTLRPFFVRVPGIETLLSPPPDQPLAKVNLGVLPFDAWVPLMSLWLCLGGNAETMRASGPYWRPEEARIAEWRTRLQQLGRSDAPKVGIVFKANPASMNHTQRSVDVSALKALLAQEHIDFVNLQHGHPGRDLAQAVPTMIDPLGAEVPLDEYGAAVAATDLLISIDTMAAHLAGAMGHPVWIMIPHSPQWTWGFDHPTTPWYTSAQLIRQDLSCNWSGTIQRIAAALGGCFPFVTSGR